MEKIYCQQHRDKNLLPVMIHFGKSSLGQQYICAVCSGVRVFNTGKIVSLKPESGYGFISGKKENVFFHFSNLARAFEPCVGMSVSFEVSFLEDGRVQATNVKPLNGGKNGN